MSSHPPLSGVKVLDLSRLLPGPYLSMLLHQLGASIVKVEDPVTGDYMRWSPPLVDGMSTVFRALNRGKKSVGINLKDPKGREAFLGMVDEADIVLESFRPGVLGRLGLAPADLLQRKPSLILVSISGYGQRGPRAHKAGHDLNFLARSGLLALNRDASGVPVVPGFQAADIAGGAWIPLAQLLAALVQRERTGEGAWIDTSMADGVLSLAALPFAELHGSSAAATDPDDAPLAGRWPCYGVYATSDGRYMSLAALEPKFWKGFCEAAGRPDWISRHLAQGVERETLRDEVAAVFREKTFAEWVEIFEPLDVCCDPVLTPWEAGLDGPFCALGLTPTLEPAPQLGQHTAEFLPGEATDTSREE